MYALTLLVVAFVCAVSSPQPLARPSDQPTPQTAAASASPQQPTAPPGAAPPRDQRRPPAAATGVLRGRVVSAENGQALRHARVDLSASELRTSRATATDGEGRFEFRSLPVGRYIVRAGKTGYVTLAYGQRRPFQGGHRVELASGQVVEDLSIALPRGAVIAGTVVNDLGEPVSDVRVAVYRLRYRAGRREVGVVGQAGRCNDLGQFRISRLPAGTYFVGTAGGSTAGGVVVEEGLTLGTTFHPSTANMGESRPVTVRAAQEVRGVDIAMVASRASSVSGTVFDSRGRPAPGAALTVKPGGDSVLALLNTAYTTVQGGGQFKVPNLLPGDYVLHAIVRVPDSRDQESVDVPVTIGGDDIGGLSVTAAPNGRITGRIAIEGEAKPDFAATALRVVAEKTDLSLPVSGDVRAGWDFEIRNVEPGRVSLSVDPIPAGWAVSRILADGRDVTESFSVALVPGGPPVAVEITLTDKPTKISGTVRQEGRSTPPEDYTLVVFGDDPAQWREGSRRVVTAKPDQHGAFTLTGLPPGRYRAVAVDSLDDGEQWNPEFLAWARSRGRLVELQDGAAVTLSVTLVKYAN